MAATIKKVLQTNVTQNGKQGRIVELTDGRKVFLVGNNGSSSGSGNSSSSGGESGGSKESPYKTGNSELDSLASAVYQQLQSGNINQDFLQSFVNVTPEKTQEFLDQAVKELSPYYQQIYTRAKENIGTNLSELTTAAKRNAENTTTGFERDLRSYRSGIRDTGLTFSGQRVREEGQLATDAQNALKDQQRSYISSRDSVLRSAEDYLGSKSLEGFQVPELQQNSIDFTPGFTGLGQGTTGTVKAPVFQFSPGITGTLEEEKRKAEELRKSELLGSYRVEEARKRLGL